MNTITLDTTELFILLITVALGGFGAFINLYKKVAILEGKKTNAQEEIISNLIKRHLRENKIPEETKIEIGQITIEVDKFKETNLKYGYKTIKFNTIFTKKPEVVVGLSMIDAGIGGQLSNKQIRGRTIRIKLEAQDVNERNFRLNCNTWLDSRIHQISAFYIAIGK